MVMEVNRLLNEIEQVINGHGDMSETSVVDWSKVTTDDLMQALELTEVD